MEQITLMVIFDYILRPGIYFIGVIGSIWVVFKWAKKTLWRIGTGIRL